MRLVSGNPTNPLFVGGGGMIPYPPAKVKGHGSIALDLLVMTPWHGRVLPVMCCRCVLGMRQLSCRIDNAVGKCKLFGDSFVNCFVSC